MTVRLRRDWRGLKRTQRGQFMTIKIEIVSQPSDADREIVLDLLASYNESAGGPAHYEPFAIRLTDPATGASVGGLWARIYYDWLFVDLLYVPEEARGKDIGSKLISEAEAFASRKGCVGVWLTTYSFQAPGFYRKLGYRAFGTLNHYPRGSKLVFFRKSLEDGRRRQAKPVSRRSKATRRRRLP
jgi:GNAT superfamily N-acetyltransferase